MPRRRPAARRSSTRSRRASSIRSRSGPDTIAKSIAIGNPADGYQVHPERSRDGRLGRRGHRRADRRRDSAARRDRRHLHRAGRRHDARGDDRPDQARRHRRATNRSSSASPATATRRRRWWPDRLTAPVRLSRGVQGIRSVVGSRARGARLRRPCSAELSRRARVELETIGSLNSIVRPLRSTLTVAVDADLRVGDEAGELRRIVDRLSVERRR